MTPLRIHYSQAAFGGDWAQILASVGAQRARWAAALARHQAVWFRGFPIQGRFSAFAQAITAELCPYTGQTDRDPVGERVYEATKVAGLWPIPLHAEMSYTPHYARQLLFYCARRRAVGGHTVLASNAQIWSSLPAPLRDKLRAEGVRYQRLFPPQGHPSLAVFRASGGLTSWQRHLGVSRPEEVEAALSARGLSPRWRGDWLDLSQTLPAFRAVPEEVWFNQLHTLCVSREVHGLVPQSLFRLATRALGFRVFDATFGGGDRFTPEQLRQVSQAHQGAAVPVRLQAEDVLFFDNLRLSHGRGRYLGSRTLQAGFVGIT